MELFAGVMCLFVVGLIGYATAQLRIGVRDLACAWVLAREGRRAPAPHGPTLVRGRARATKLLSPPGGGARVVAWAARGSYGFGADEESAPFVVEGAHDVHVEAKRLVLLAHESTDMFGNRVRALAPDAEVVVYGWLEERAGRPWLTDVPGRGVVVAASQSAALANIVRGVLALVAVAVFVTVVVTAHLP